MIPETTLIGLDRYVQHRIKPGGFLFAVLTNDLYGAISYADPDNLAALTELVRHCSKELPGNVWGSTEKVSAWLAKRNC